MVFSIVHIQQGVPVLQDGDHRIWESVAICEYVNERWAEGRLLPADMAGSVAAADFYPPPSTGNRVKCAALSLGDAPPLS